MKMNDVPPARVAFVIERLVLLSSPLLSSVTLSCQNRESENGGVVDAVEKEGSSPTASKLPRHFSRYVLTPCVYATDGFAFCVSSVDLLCNVRITGKCIAAKDDPISYLSRCS